MHKTSPTREKILRSATKALLKGKIKMDSFLKLTDQSIDARRLPWLCEQYLAAVRGKIARRTHMHYANKLRWFLLWSEKYEVITNDDMVSFRDFLAETNLRKMTQRQTIGRVTQMFRWAAAAGLAAQDYSIWLPTIKAAKPIFSAATIADVQRLLDAAGGVRHATRDRAFIALLAASGLRLGEATALTTNDIVFFEDGTGKITVRSGKNSQSRMVIISRRWTAYLREWIDVLGPNRPLFPSHGVGEKGVRQDNLYLEFKKIAKLAGLKLNCHDMRRFFATQWVINYPGRLSELQAQLGHSDPAMTARYVWLAGSDIHTLIKSEEPVKRPK